MSISKPRVTEIFRARSPPLRSYCKSHVTRSLASINTAENGVLYWYKQSALLMHMNKFFSLDSENHLHELVLSKVLKYSKRVVTLSYPDIPFFELNYVLALHFVDASNPGSEPSDENTLEDELFRIIGRSLLFFPMRYLPGHPKYIPYSVTGRNKDFLTPGMFRIQKWMRMLSRKRLEERKLALAMGLHPRLGLNSSLFVLESDLLRFVVIFFFFFIFFSH